VAALTPRVADLVVHVRPLLDTGAGVPGSGELGPGEEVEAGAALATGPGDAVSVALIDAGVHRATLGLRMVVPDALLQPADGHIDDMGDWEDDMGDDVAEGWQGGAAASEQAPPGPVGLPQPAAAPAAPRGKRGTRPGYRDPAGQPAGDAHPAEFTAFDQLHSFPGVGHSMSMLADVEMGVTAELGRTKLTVRDVLGLNQGSIIELDRAAGSPVDVVVNGTLIARGEVVVIDEEFGIRITEIVGMDEGGAQAQLPMAQ
jgi:flagellar motor switch protein FliN/FliY